jgi:very-short-patch-repair endonuclease
VNLSDEQGWIGRVDGLYRPWGIVLELDSEEHHGQDTDEDHDAARDGRIEALGLVVVRRTWGDLTQRPAELVARLTELLETRDPAA